MYVCGMTPKERPHIGHAFMFVQMDVMRRYLEYRGYSIYHVQNFTDIDDKIIDRAAAAGRDPMEWSREQTEAYFETMDQLHILHAHEFPRVTESIDRIIDHIHELVLTEHAYTTSTGVYFDVTKFAAYGQLSGRGEDDGLAGARVEVDDEKRGARDWALWKLDTDGDIGWESPWGRGRPGWHIECSTMIRHSLGDQIDIHGGGQDLVFPHHENEIAQAEAATNCPPFVSYWAHTGLVLTDGEKMAHSLENFTAVADILRTTSPDVLRLHLLSVHYRSSLNFSPDGLQQSRAAYIRLLTVLKSRGQDTHTDGTRLEKETEKARIAFENAMDDDFNAPRAIGAIFDFGHTINRLAPHVPHETVASAQTVFEKLLRVVGIELHEPDGEDTDTDPYIDMLVQVRRQLREAKQWALADQIRDGLIDLGVMLEDTPDATVWRRE